MGLSISRSIVVAHGGRLWAMANEPRGAVFQFALPAGESIPIQKRELPIARWQAEEEDRSARRVFHRPQLSAVGFDDRAGDRESDAHPSDFVV